MIYHPGESRRALTTVQTLNLNLETKLGTAQIQVPLLDIRRKRPGHRVAQEQN